MNDWYKDAIIYSLHVAPTSQTVTIDAIDLQMELEGHEWSWFFRPGRVL